MKYDHNGMQKILADGRYMDVGNLPSNFFPYVEDKVAKVYARPFKVAELRLISRAAALKDESYLVRALDVAISMDAGRLTTGDFYYLLMWMRLHSMPKSPYVMEWRCGEALVVNRETGRWLMNDHTFVMPEDEENYRVEECGEENVEIVHQTQLELTCLDESFAGLPQQEGIEFDFPRARDLQDIRTAKDNPELQHLVRGLQWIKSAPGRQTIEEKANWLNEQSNDLQLFDDLLRINDTVVHGVNEHMRLNCRKCLFNAPHKLRIDPFTFFR